MVMTVCRTATPAMSFRMDKPAAIGAEDEFLALSDLQPGRAERRAVSLKRHASVRLVVPAIERVNASTDAVRHRDSGTVDVERDRSFALPGAAAAVSLAASMASAAGRRCVGNASAHDLGATMNAPTATLATLETCFTI
jgi:hypothetical protein